MASVLRCRLNEHKLVLNMEVGMISMQSVMGDGQCFELDPVDGRSDTTEMVDRAQLTTDMRMQGR